MLRARRPRRPSIVGAVFASLAVAYGRSADTSSSGSGNGLEKATLPNRLQRVPDLMYEFGLIDEKSNAAKVLGSKGS